MAAFLHPEAPEQPVAGQHSLLDVLDTAQAWGVDIIRQLDSPSRTRVFKTCRALQQFVLQAAPQATVTLLAYSGLAEVTWQRRLARAEQALTTRGPGQRPGTKVVLRIPTPHPTALPSVLSMSEAARQCYAALEVQQYDYPTAAGPDPAPSPLQPVPLPIHTLTLNHMSGLLPSPDLLPQLRELQVRLRFSSAVTKVDTFPNRARALLASIAPYVRQLTSLSLWSDGTHTVFAPWHEVLGKTTSLTSFTTEFDNVNDLLPLLLKHAPRLERLSMPLGGLRGDYSDKTWGMRELLCDCWDTASTYAGLPASPEGLTLVRGAEYAIDIHFNVVGREGLDAAMAQRLAHQWRFNAPIIAHVDLPTDLAPHDTQAGTEAALMQLSVLPAGSKVQFTSYRDHGLRVLAPAVAAMTATAHHLTHLTVVPPPAEATSAEMVTLCEHQPALTHVAVYRVDHRGAAAQVPWPWQCLHIITGYSVLTLSNILRLPDPTGGQYDIEPYELRLNDMEQWTPETLTKLHNRLSHLTFVIRDKLSIEISPHGDTAIRDQPTVLRKALQALAACRWRFVSDQTSVEITLQWWTVTRSLISELSALPVFDVPCTLVLTDCQWPRTASYKNLASVVPACYSTWEFRDYFRSHEVAHIKQICMGAAARGEASQKLSLHIQTSHELFTTEDRSEVEACIDEEGLGGCVQVEWAMSIY